MRISIIEDNLILAQALEINLKDQGHAVDLINTYPEAQDYLNNQVADLIIMDLNLGSHNSLDLLRAMRHRGDVTPVLLLTAISSTKDRVKGLDAGADDYLVKPFAMNELEARIRALFRRSHKNNPFIEPLGKHLQFNRSTRQLMHLSKPVKLPRKELALLECFIKRKGELISKDVLLSRLYGIGSDADTSVIEIYVSRLRKRLAEFGITIETARGLGYMLNEE